MYYDAFEIRLPRILHLSVFYIQNEAKSRSIWLHLVLTLSSDKMRTIFRAKFNCKNALLSYVFMWFLFAIYKMIGERLAKNIIKASCITYINIQNKTQQLHKTAQSAAQMATPSLLKRPQKGIQMAKINNHWNPYERLQKLNLEAWR